MKLEVLNWFDKGEHSTDIQNVMGLSDSTMKQLL